jgi:UDP-N-acetylglucosamine:LPS N-acetylglucosamine transferase
MSSFKASANANTTVSGLPAIKISQIRSSSSREPMNATAATKSLFVTVGSTRFNDLIETVMSKSFFSAIISQNFKHLTIQHGSSHVNLNSLGSTNELTIDVYDYKKDIAEDLKNADLVICHAGKMYSVVVEWIQSPGL